MRILFLGDTWQGSSARSLREALSALSDVAINDVGLDHYLPKHRSMGLRLVNRMLRPLQVRDLEAAVQRAFVAYRPDVVVIHKGKGVRGRLVRRLQAAGVPVVNLFPDCSPWAQGRDIREAMGLYDLVISTKPFHPTVWQSSYGYKNRCVWVPHGYDPAAQYWGSPAPADRYDVVLCATWRSEYQRLMIDFAKAMGDTGNLAIAVAGNGWSSHRHELPQDWQFVGPKMGRGYGEFVRSGRIVIAPVTRGCFAAAKGHPGDEDTRRTYELAAAYCFFLHQRTAYVTGIYDAEREVPLWSDGIELATLVRQWLPNEKGRRETAARAHRRAVPAYSIEHRANEVLQHIQSVTANRPA